MQEGGFYLSMTDKISIAIDGPSAAGKSTIARRIAEKYQYIYIDTGAMYRCVAYYMLTHQVDLNDEEAVSHNLKQLDIQLTNDGRVYLNGEEVTSEIRQDQVSLAASTVSAYPQVRSTMVAMQRKMSYGGGVVLDGRDIGTVVLPNAELKIYQIASSQARAQRRYKENLSRNLPADFETILKEIEIRDYQDMHRAASPLRKAPDARELDTSNMSIEEVVNCVSGWIDEILERRMKG